jgi:hypothetical protein
VPEATAAQALLQFLLINILWRWCSRISASTTEINAMRQLYWYEEKHMGGDLRADCPKNMGRGFYRIRIHDDYQVTGHRLGGKRNMIFIGKERSTLDEAKAAAQAHLAG